jgi:uncharacterized damage-inducible protein DinB
MVSLVTALFEHNLWANQRLVDACRGLSDVVLNATVEGTAGTIRETLMHIAGAEQRYVMRLCGRTPTYGEQDGWPGLALLAQALEESGSLFIELTAVADPDEVLESQNQGQQASLPAAVVYVQAINHATEHRSQIATILTQQGVDAPDVSGWAWRRDAQEGSTGKGSENQER